MTAKNEHLRKFQALLRELFQFDCAELDFGMYRIMNHKRALIEKFIARDLADSVADQLRRGALNDQARTEEALEILAQRIREDLGRDALDGDGELADEYRKSNIGKRYLLLQSQLRGEPGRQLSEAEIFNHLFVFFSRYYDGGDFISKRRYSRRERYAIPYNGEDLHLHWSNKDQYYVKTEEYFRNYAFVSRDVTVRFRLQTAQAEQNDVNGDRRFFLPQLAALEWNEKTDELTIPFEHRPLTEREARRYGKRQPQDGILDEAMEDIPERLEGVLRPLAALTAERRKTADGVPVTFFEHHFRQYASRNTSDFFVHKDLKGFLVRELDFYLKNEVLGLDEMEAAGEHRADAWFQLMRAIRGIGVRIIDFLDQIERFQKMLWEKRKFVTGVRYCITVGSVDNKFHSEIAACEAQWTEWQDLLHIDERDDSVTSEKAGREAFLERHPTLVLDTSHFDDAFTDRLLADFDDLDEKTDGLLVHSENWQALNLLSERYRGQVDCMYIDPPYNTGQQNAFLYKDSYRHGSWMSMMHDRLVACRTLASSRSGIFVSTDDGEYANLKFAMSATWGADNFVADVIWNSRKSVSSDTLISTATNHTTFFARDKKALDSDKASFRLPQPGDKFSNPDNDPSGPWTLDPMDAPNVRENLTYVVTNPETGEEYLPPTGRCWRFERATTETYLRQGRIVFANGGNGRPMYKRYLSEAQAKGKAPTTLWNDVKTTTDATRLLIDVLGRENRELVDRIKPKPTELVERCARLLAGDSGLVLDFFAGSGTTAHAILNLNREDGGRRKFVLVEQDRHFDGVLLPRLKKVIYTPAWKDGRPARMAEAEEAERRPRILKCVALESYEDALNNISFDDLSGQEALKFDDYLPRYMLQWETKHSDTLLNIENMTRPLNYKLGIHSDGQTGERTVDIPETFNYLLGLRVRRREVHYDGERRYVVYRGQVDSRPIAVIWRDTEGWGKKDLERDRTFVADRQLATGADEIFVNGASLHANATVLEPLFKAKMFAGADT